MPALKSITLHLQLNHCSQSSVSKSASAPGCMIPCLLLLLHKSVLFFSLHGNPASDKYRLKKVDHHLDLPKEAKSLWEKVLHQLLTPGNRAVLPRRRSPVASSNLTAPAESWYRINANRHRNHSCSQDKHIYGVSYFFAWILQL